MDFTKLLDQKAHTQIAEKQFRSRRLAARQALQVYAATQIRTELNRRPQRSTPLVRTS